jgi:hypothetical protein
VYEYNHKRYIKVQEEKIIDTAAPVPHTECYFIINGILFAENIDGTNVMIGKIVEQSDEVF